MQATNVSFEIYQGFNASSPYPADGTKPKAVRVAGLLRHQVKAGRFGSAPWNVYWTHLMLVSLGTNARDAYNSQLVAANVSQGDTILISDYPIAGRCTAFLVALVQRSQDQLRLYLDRCQPKLSPCPKKPKLLQPGCCAGFGFPDTLYATAYAEQTFYPPCACVNGATGPIVWNDLTRLWSGSLANACGTTLTVTLDLFCQIEVSASDRTVVNLGTQHDSCAPVQLHEHCQMACPGQFDQLSAFNVIVTQ
jgi:hypothetical protein